MASYKLAASNKVASLKYASHLKIDAGALQQPGGVIVLSSRPIPGRNSLVISTGLSDFMDALHSAGGAVIAITCRAPAALQEDSVLTDSARVVRKRTAGKPAHATARGLAPFEDRIRCHAAAVV
jgi:hypothetical protein